MTGLAVNSVALDDFYKETAHICFTLLGLWWIVVQLKFGQGAGEPERRRHAYGVLLFFLLPGTMALVSAVNSEISALWRLAFGVAAALGVIEVFLYFGGAGIKSAGATALRWVALAVYGLIVLFAIRPKLAIDLGLGMAPREVEAVLVGLLVVIGVHMAWFGLTEPPERAPARPSA